MKTIRLIARQGDIGFIPVMEIPIAAKQKVAEKGYLVLANGETTGHFHGINDDGSCALMEDPANKDNSFLVVNTDTAIVEHQEHAPITLKKGKYHVVRQVEWSDAEEPIVVRD